MKRVDIAEAKARLSELIDATLRGEEVIIARRDKPLARLVPMGEARTVPQFGKYRGRLELANDFEAALGDFSSLTFDTQTTR
ncbi:MAG: type II toxin-antitoxin system prevent-host-death family antitoxin [Polyangiaceae bacterium]